MTQITSTPNLSERIQNLSESATIAMAQKARELKSKGHDVINLSLGEPDFQTPQHIKDAAKAALDEGYTFYTPVPGYPELREAIATKLQRDNHLKWQAENIVVSTGAKQSLANIFLSLLDKGDEVIVLGPYWVTYKEIVKLADGVPVLLNGALENDFKVTPEQIQAAITPKTKAILYSSPSNPTGAVFSKEELRAIADVIAPHNQIMVVADEIYEYIVFEEGYFSMGAFEDIAERVITVNGFSKGFAMTGWRLGYMAAPKWLASACAKIQGQVTSGTCSITQRAAITAISSDLTSTHEMTKAYLRRRDLVWEGLNSIEGFQTPLPKGAFYLFPDISAFFGKSTEDGKWQIQNADDFAMFLLNEAHVSLVTGSAFGAPNNVRMSYAASDESLKEAVERIKEKVILLK